MTLWIERRCKSYGRACVLAAVFLSAVIFAPHSIETFSLVKLTVLWILGICSLGFWLASSFRHKGWPPPSRLLCAAAAFVFFASLSTVFSASAQLSLLGMYTRYGGLIPYVTYALIALSIYGLFWQEASGLRQIAHAASAASIVVAGYVLIQAAGLDWHDWRNPGGAAPSSPGSTMGNSNFAGGYLGTTLPLSIFWVFSTRSSRTRLAAGAFLGLHLLALWYTQARGGMVAALAGIAILIFCYRGQLPAWIKVGAALAASVISAIAIVAIWHPGADRPPEPIGSVRQLDSFSLQNRFWYWQTAVRIFSDHPVLGTGPDTYYSFYPLYRLAEDGRTMGLNLPDKPHNVVLEHFSNLGVLGGGAYLITAGLGLWYGSRRSRRLHGSERLLVASFTGAFAAYLSQSFFSIDVPALAATGWVMLGAIAAAADPAAIEARGKGHRPGIHPVPERRTSPPRPARIQIFASSLTLFGLAAGLIAIAAGPSRADMKASLGQAEEAIKVNPLEAQYNINAGDTVRSVAVATRDPGLALRLYERAERHYRKALEIQPRNIAFLIKIATLHATRAETLDPPQIVEATRLWKHIHKIDRTNRDVRTAYRSARSAERRTLLETEEAVRTNPESIEGWIRLGTIHMKLGNSKEAQNAANTALRLDPSSRRGQSLLSQTAGRP